MFPTFQNHGFKPLHTHGVCIVGRETARPGAAKEVENKLTPWGATNQYRR